MGAGVNSGGGGGRRRRGRTAHRPMADINVTPMVDVMLVLLVIFMVAAPLMNGGVELDLPNVQGKALPQPDKEPVVVSITKDGRVYLGLEEQAPTNLEELLPRLKAIVANRRGGDEPVMIRGDRVAQYEAVSAVIQKLSEAGFRKLTIVTVSQKAK